MAYREHPVNNFQDVAAGAQLIDVREPAEVAGGTLPGAMNIPLGSLSERLGELDPGRPVVLVCRSGARSGHAARWLDQQGFGEVVNLSGGMLAYTPQVAATA
jgi:rhodanese-related sulfurtransferase